MQRRKRTIAPSGMRMAALAAMMFVTQALVACGGDDDGSGTTGAPALTAQESCAALQGFKVEASAIGKPTSGALVQTTTLVAADASNNIDGEYCAVTGIIFPATAGAPTMQFRVNLPTQWNGKALQWGGGGFDGSLIAAVGRLPGQPKGSASPLARGFLTLGGDGGHKAVSAMDGSFALNDEALMNFGQLSVKKTHDVSMAIIGQRYGTTPKRFYFFGSSQGGHEALDAAARYGADYDGVIAHYPAYNVQLLHEASLHVGRVMYANGGAGWISNAKRQLLVNAVYAACDSLDGLTDGLVGNVPACNTAFTMDTVKATLRCLDGTDTGDGCLSDAQIAAVEKISSPFDLGFPLAGQQVFARWPLLEGATFPALGNVPGSGLGMSPVPAFAATYPGVGFLYAIGSVHARYFIARDPLLDPMTYDPANYKERLQQVAEITDVTQQSLEPFRARGGKLVLVHGAMDSLISPHNSVDYYNRQVQALGQSSVDDFIRFYMIPGFDHGWGPYNLGYDGLTVLDDWVERGAAPETVVSMDNNAADPATARTRPMCRWPQYPRFTGAAGSENSADGFTCTAP